MAIVMPIPFNEEQLNMITGANDRSNFYLEDDVEEVQEPSTLSRLGGNVKEGLGMMLTGDATSIGGPDVSDRFPWGAINKGREVAGKGVGLLQRGLTEPRTQSGIGGMITQAETASQVLPTSVSEAKARGEKTFWVGDQEKLAVTAEELQAFKNSNAYDPTSEKSALSQWSDAWTPTSVETVSETVEASPRRDVREILIEEEGLKLTPYPDPGGGKLAVGVGHTLGEGEEVRDITEAEARENLEVDIQEAYASVDRLAEKFDIDVLQPELRDELMMMAFQMGATGLSKFKKMWAGIRNQDWNEVVVQMADSRWAKSQTPERAARTINRVATLLGV